jgi:hypothetical protein
MQHLSSINWRADRNKGLSCVTRFRMSATDLLSLIDREIATLKKARALIARTAPAVGKRKPGRPFPAVADPKKVWKLSPETRTRMSAASKAQWAARRKATK